MFDRWSADQISIKSSVNQLIGISILPFLDPGPKARRGKPNNVQKPMERGSKSSNLGHFDPKIKEKNPNDGQNHRILGPVAQNQRKRPPRMPKSSKFRSKGPKINKNDSLSDQNHRKSGPKTQKSTKMTPKKGKIIKI